MRKLPNTIAVSNRLEVFNASIRLTHYCSIGNRYCKNDDGLCDAVPGSFADECGIDGCKKYG